MPRFSQTGLTRLVHSKLAMLSATLLLMFLLPRLLSWLSITHYEAGEAPSPSFLVAVTGHTGKAFELLPLQETRGRALWIQPATFEDTSGEQAIRILAQRPDGALIETLSHSDSVTLTSHYRIANGRVAPVSLQTFSPGHVMSGFLLAIALSKLLFFVLRKLAPLRPHSQENESRTIA